MSRKVAAVNILRITSLGHALADMYWLIFPILLPLIKKEFSLSYTQAGLLITAITVTTGLGSFISGYLSDRFGQRILLSGGFLIASLALILCANTSFYWQLLLASLLVGAGASTFHPGTIALLMNLFSERRGRVLGIFMLSGWIGAAIMLAGVSYLAGRMFSWRQIVFILAWPGLIFAPFFFRSLRFSIRKRHSHPQIESKSAHLSRDTLLLLIIFFAANLALTMGLYGVHNFIPTFMVHAKDISVEKAGYFYIFAAAGGMIGSFFSGRLVDKFSSLLVILMATVTAIPVILLLTLATNPINLALLLVLFGICYSSIFPPQNVYLANLVPRNALGRTYGLIQCLSILVGAAAPGITGFLADNLGLISALQLGAVPLLLAGALFIYLRTRDSLASTKLA